jgi:hypothetical protein
LCAYLAHAARAEGTHRCPAHRPARPCSEHLQRPDRRRALELLAGCGAEGCSEAIMRAHGFTTEQMVELVRAGLATATGERVMAGRKAMEVATVRITDAGRERLS